MTLTVVCLLLVGVGAIRAADEAESTLTKVGQAAPAFTVTTLAGKAFDRAALKGKVVLVNFFATWCGPCLAEMPRSRSFLPRFRELLDDILPRQHA